MFWLGLLTILCSVPGFTWATIPAPWWFLSCVMSLAFFLPGQMRAVHWLGITFLAYAVASAMWSPISYLSGEGLWHWLFIIAPTFWLGSVLSNLRPIFVGMAVGLTVSSAVSIVNHFGYFPVDHYTGVPSGLFYNAHIHGEIIAFVIVSLLAERALWLIPGLLPGILLSESRAALMLLATGAVFVFVRPVIALIAISVFVPVYFFGLYHISPSDAQRFMFWVSGIMGTTWLGHGPNSYQGFSDGFTLTLGPAHNDYIQLAFEFGIGSVMVYAIYAVGLLRTSEPYWPVFAIFALASVFSFPLYTPVTVFIGALVAGHLCRDGLVFRSVGIHRGHAIARRSIAT